MVQGIDTEKTGAFKHLIVFVIMLFIIGFLLAASFLQIDVVTKGTGKVIPSKRIQLLENLEGGIVKNIYVKQGDIVKKDQILIKLDDIRFKSEYEEGFKNEIALRIRVAVLSALATDKNFVPTKVMMTNLPDSVLAEKNFYINKKAELASYRARYDLLQKEIKMTEPLVKEGDMSTVELLRLQSSLENIQGNISTWYATVGNDLNEANDKLSEIVEKNKATLDRLNRTTIRAPLYGIVKEVFVTTEGGVVKADDPIIEIVPLDDTLLIEASVEPRDVGFLHKGLPADVKVTAYDYTVYGQMLGKVENISADSFKNEKTNTNYYKVWVRTDRNYLTFNGKRHLILPGMEASVDILTGKRTLLHYILKPFMKAKERAFTER